ncbi:MAG: ABC transporter substrate-binding protein [Candidatus Microthrix subdominans]|jgi:ABC-type branched-subunit amino acid transport system substrate-binding protein|uniref:ABC transporter substrate-binding protein n=1 Tax=Candidatus Neomicrothrix sp. TaxID=2719034 RepID=UPI001B6E6000|nr:ABC transporter substrate-binding protein [Candidatus Microthrix sp.]MBP7594033.1 ABC transporter substrate-binding protein [Candidatus Microthrix sp.]MBP9064471.1 ABC transporter substrate-binding protein [Candidatus Microthrix sp.]HMS48640.1 ABC transporter substrate-binding protein [Candidatus Microthrix sp.]
MFHKRKWTRLAAGVLALSLVTAACGNDDESSSDTTQKTDESGGGNDNSLIGMKGTTPLVDLGDEFKGRLMEIDPSLVDFNYAAESYDAAIILGLAATEAKTDGSAMAEKINGITRDGEKCTDFAACKKLIEAGTDIDYDGQSGPLEFSGNGEPTEASYGVLQFGTTDCEDTTECLDDSKTQFIVATAPEEADVDQVAVEGTREGNGTLEIGSLLPKTGSLAFLGPPEFAGVDLAVQEMNEAGGVLGNDVVHIEGDSGDTENGVAPKTVSTLLAKDVDAIIGAASSSVSLSVIDTIVNAGVIMFSPANTSKEFSDYNDKGLYFRNAPSDILQGSVLADVILEDGHQAVFILALNDDYGTGLADDLQKSLEAGGAEVVGKEIYDPKATDFSDIVGKAKSADPDAVALIGFDESSKILSTMIEQGIGPSAVPVYGVDGNMGNALAENFEAGK